MAYLNKNKQYTVKSNKTESKQCVTENEKWTENTSQSGWA